MRPAQPLAQNFCQLGKARPLIYSLSSPKQAQLISHANDFHREADAVSMVMIYLGLLGDSYSWDFRFFSVPKMHGGLPSHTEPRPEFVS